VTFEDNVKAALDELPPELAAALTNIAVVVEDENPDDPDLLGLYHGVPLPERGEPQLVGRGARRGRVTEDVGSGA